VKKINIKGIRYYCEDSDKLPSVTSILSKTRDFDIQNLINKKHRRLIRERGVNKADNEIALPIKVGNYAHSMIENWLLDPTTNIQKCLAKHFLPHLPEFFSVLKIEKAIFHQLRGYAGTLDLLIESNQGETVLIDFKTSQKAKSLSHCKDYFTQLAAYGLALQEIEGITIDRYQIIFAYREKVGVRDPRFSDSYSRSKEEMSEFFGEFTSRLAKFKSEEAITF